MDDESLKRRFYPEVNIGGFTHVDGTVSFFNQIAAIVRPSDTVLDFGAGRGGPLFDDQVEFRRSMADLKGRCKHLDGCDVDPVILENPFLDDAKVIVTGEPLPYENERFDLVDARFVFEHIEDPHFVISELLRVAKPGGVIAAVTPNKWGYIAMSARMVPNRLHVKVLTRSQPNRKAKDVFPTQYKLNTPRALTDAFGDRADVYIVSTRQNPRITLVCRGYTDCSNLQTSMLPMQ
ncbi:class I SAM-dependent methyltransferase [Mycolicibacterium vaccae]|nr:class I SAM-dependent methyltransferase [Mycolicibacterium vaccae]